MGGVDKTLLMLGGRTMLDRIVDRIRPQCEAGLVLSANGEPARFTRFTGPVLADMVPGCAGPLAGIVTALDMAAEIDPVISHVVSVPGDTPFLPRDLVARLFEAQATSRKPIAHAASGGREHYTSALWPVALRKEMRAALKREERGVGAFIEKQGAAVVEWPVAAVDPFLNINTPEDLAAAEAFLGSF